MNRSGIIVHNKDGVNEALSYLCTIRFIMRRSKTDSISSIIQQFVKENNLERSLYEYRLIASWDEVVGKLIAKQTKEIFIRDGVLYLKINSPLIKKELMMLKDQLIQKLNERIGARIVFNLKFI